PPLAPGARLAALARLDRARAVAFLLRAFRFAVPPVAGASALRRASRLSVALAGDSPTARAVAWPAVAAAADPAALVGDWPADAAAASVSASLAAPGVASPPCFARRRRCRSAASTRSRSRRS